MSGKPTVSVVIPAYNAGECIENTLRSILNQDRDDYEIILVDDASTDATYAVAERTLRDAECPWQIIRHEKNGGECASRNTGMRRASGEYLYFMDADDLADSNLLSALFRPISESGADIAFCGYCVRKEPSGEEVRQPVRIDSAQKYNGSDWAMMRLSKKISPTVWGMMFRKRFLDAIGLFFSEGCSAGGDIEFVTKALSMTGNVVFSTECPYIYRLHDGMGSVKDANNAEKKKRRYRENTEAHFRAAEYMMNHSIHPDVRDAARYFLLPQAQIRMLTLHAKSGDRAAFDAMIRNPEVRASLSSTRKSLPLKPEVFLKAMLLLACPGMYYSMRSWRTRRENDFNSGREGSFLSNARLAFHDFYRPKWRGKKISCGERNPDKTFYVIYLPDKGSGFLANFHHVMLHIEIARARNWIPVVDMENYRTHYNEDEPINGTNNAWEYFFEQPENIGLAEVYQSRNVVLSLARHPHYVQNIYKMSYLKNNRKLKKYHNLINKEMRFNAATEQYINEAWNDVRKNDGAILAVMSRGTDFRNLRLPGHSIQPDAALLLERAKRMMKEREIPYCYLKTEERSVFELFRTELGKNLLSTESLFYDEMDATKGIVHYRPEIKHAAYRLALDYLKNVVIASRCDYLISGITNGSVAALEFNGGKYKAVDLVNLGHYQ